MQSAVDEKYNFFNILKKNKSDWTLDNIRTEIGHDLSLLGPNLSNQFFLRFQLY